MKISKKKLTNYLVLLMFWSLPLNVVSQILFKKRVNLVIGILAIILIIILRLKTEKVEVGFNRKIAVIIIIFINFMFQKLNFLEKNELITVMILISFSLMPLLISFKNFNYNFFLGKSIIISNILTLILFIKLKFMGGTSDFNYMTVGTPLAISGIIYVFDYLKTKKLKLLFYLNFFLILTEGQRGALIPTIIFLLYILVKKRKLRITKVVIALLVVVVLYVMKDSIVEYLYMDLGIKARLFEKLYYSAHDQGSGFFSGREMLYKEGLDLFYKAPIFGRGIFNYYNNTNYMYTHFIFLDILLNIGVIGLVFFIIFLVKIMRKKSNQNQKKFLYINLIVMSLYLVSGYYVFLPSFWFIISLGIEIISKKKSMNKSRLLY